MTKPIILYGGNGFIGRHLAVAAHAAGLPALVISRTTDPDFLRTHAPSATAMSASEFLSGRGDDEVRRASALVYLASRSVPGTAYATPATELADTVHPAFELFHRVYAANPKLAGVFISSGGTVYGHAPMGPVSEAAPTAPISPYGLGKALTEEALRFCGRTQGNTTAILRLSNAVGRWHRNPKQGVIGVALEALREGGTLTIYGDGEQVRDYVHADDVADAILATLRAGQSGTWNVGSGLGHTLNQVLALVESTTHRRLAVRREPARSVDVRSVVLDISKFKAMSGWRPRRSLEKAIDDIWKARG